MNKRRAYAWSLEEAVILACQLPTDAEIFPIPHEVTKRLLSLKVPNRVLTRSHIDNLQQNEVSIDITPVNNGIMYKLMSVDHLLPTNITYIPSIDSLLSRLEDLGPVKRFCVDSVDTMEVVRKVAPDAWYRIGVKSTGGNATYIKAIRPDTSYQYLHESYKGNVWYVTWR